jgi:long-chain acyl-CoA synthetase
VVAVQLPDLPQFLIAYFGALKAGLVVLPLYPLLMAPELEYHLGDSAAALLIGSEGMHAEAVKACETTGVPLYLVSMGPDPLPGGARPFSELFGAAPLDEPGGVPRAPDDTAVLVYTSGTTDRPKGAELTHFQLHMNSTIAGGLFGVRSDDVVLAVLPIGGVPTMLHALAQLDIAGRDLSALRVAVSGGASLPEDIMRAFEDKYRIEVLEGYGITETASSCTFNRPGDRKVLSIGKPLWGVRMRVCDRAGRTLRAGREHVGEILIRGHNVMKGYLGRPETTAEARCATAGCTPATWAIWTRTASTSSSTGRRTW